MIPKKVVLFYATIIAPGGAERLIVRELEYLRKQGIDARLFVFEYNEESLFGTDKKHIKKINAKGMLSRSIALLRELRKFKPDLIICHENIWYLYLPSVFLRIPIVTHAHGSFMWHVNDYRKYTLLQRGAFKTLQKRVIGHNQFLRSSINLPVLERLKWELFSIFDYFSMRRSKKIFSLSKIGKSEISALYGMDADVVYAGVDIPNDKNLPDIRKRLKIDNKRVILTVNRLDVRKRIDLLLRSTAILIPKHPDLFLIVVGKGEEMKNLVNLSRELGIEKNVLFTGFVSEEELPAYYAACDLFVFPAWCEYGLSPIEALFFNKKVLVSEDALVADSISKSPNVYFTKPHVDELARKMESALEAPEKESRDFVVKNLNWDAYFKKILDLCKEVK